MVVAEAIASSPADPGGSAIFATLPAESLAGVQQATESSLALGVRIAALAAARADRRRLVPGPTIADPAD